MKKHPEIITELIAAAENFELKTLHFNLGENLSYERAFEEIDRTMHYFSAYLFIERLEEGLFRDERYTIKYERNIGSIVEQRTFDYWFREQDEHFRLIDERIESHKKKDEYKHIEKWEVEQEIELKDKVLVELNREIQPKIIEMLKTEYQGQYEDEWEERWNELDLFEECTSCRYERRTDMPPPFNNWSPPGSWMQFYFARDREGCFYWRFGKSTSTSSRWDHGLYGHLFGMLNDETPIPTYFFTYDSRNRFIFDRKEKSLWLEFMDLVTNNSLSKKQSNEILRNVGRIESPDW